MKYLIAFVLFAASAKAQSIPQLADAAMHREFGTNATLFEANHRYRLGDGRTGAGTVRAAGVQQSYYS